MKRWLLLLLAVAVVGVVAPQASFAQSNTAGINLSWSDCGAAGTANKSFACTSNSGSNIMVVSFFAPGGIDSLLGATCSLDVITDQATLPSWWNMQTGGCRSASLSSSFDFTGGPFTCTDPWSGVAAGGVSMKVNDGQQVTDPRKGRINVVCAVQASAAIAPDSTLEYYMAKVTVLSQKTTGTGSCAGCLFPACIRLNSVLLSQPAFAGVPRDLTFNNTPPGGGSQQITWQAGVGADCNLVPTRNRTWGQIKSLYR